MGFEAVVSAPLWAPGANGNLLLAADDDRLAPSLGWDGPAHDGIARLVEEAGRQGLKLMLDLVADRVADDGALAARFGFRPDPRGNGLDPRVDPVDRGAAHLPDDPEAWFEHLAGRLADLAGLGVAGYRCLNPDRIAPEAWGRIIARVRETAPDCLFLAVTPGLAFEAREALAPARFDAVFSSIRWWDGRAGWLVDENEVHRRIAPSIGFPEAPFGRRLARDHDNGEDTRRAVGRALWLAAALTDGLLVPMGFEFGARAPLSPSPARPATGPRSATTRPTTSPRRSPSRMPS